MWDRKDGERDAERASEQLVKHGRLCGAFLTDEACVNLSAELFQLSERVSSRYSFQTKWRLVETFLTLVRFRNSFTLSFMIVMVDRDFIIDRSFGWMVDRQSIMFYGRSVFWGDG